MEQILPLVLRWTEFIFSFIAGWLRGKGEGSSNEYDTDSQYNVKPGRSKHNFYTEVMKNTEKIFILFLYME